MSGDLNFITVDEPSDVLDHFPVLTLIVEVTRVPCASISAVDVNLKAEVCEAQLSQRES